MPRLTAMFRRTLRIALALLLALALLAAGGLWYVRRNLQPLVAERLEDLSARSGLRIDAGAVFLTVFPFPALAFADASVEGDGWRFSVAYATARPDVTALLRGRLQPAAVSLTRPRLQGRLPLPLLSDAALPGADAPAAGGDGAAAPGAPDAAAFLERALSPLMTLLAEAEPDGLRLTMTHGEADVEGSDATRLTLDGLHCRLRLFSSAHVNAALSLDQARLAPPGGTASVLRGLEIAGDGRLPAPWLRAARLTVRGTLERTDWLARLRVDADILTNGATWRATADLDGLIRKDGALIPVVVAGDAASVGSAGSGDGAPPGAAGDGMRPLCRVKATRLELGRDRGQCDATLRLGGPEAFRLDGSLRFSRASLTEWLGFARSLTPGLQHALDDLTDGHVAFSLDGTGLRVPHAEAVAAGSRFTGVGGVAHWSAPVVALDLKAESVDLGRALPEALGDMPPAPTFDHGAFTPAPGSPVVPGEINIGYDIRLGAATVRYGPLVVKEGHVVIKPGLIDKKSRLEDTLLLAEGRLCGGRLKSETILGGDSDTPIAIRLQARDVSGGPLARALPALAVASGRLRADVAIQSRGKTLPAFLDRLRGSAAVRAENGSLRSLSGKGRPLPFSSLNLEAQLRGGAWKQNRLGLNGQWEAALRGEGLEASGRLTGSFWFGGADALSFRDAPGEIALALSPARFDAPEGLRASLSGDFSCQAARGEVSVAKAHAAAFGIQATGEARLVSGKTGPAWQGKAAVTAQDLSRALRLAGLGTMSLPRPLNALDASATFKGDAASLSLRDLRARVDGQAVLGTLDLAWRDALSLRYSLRAPRLDLDRYMGGSAPAAPRRAVAPREPWDLRRLRAFKAQGDLAVEDFSLWRMHVRGLRCATHLDNGSLHVEGTGGSLYGGSLKVQSHLRFDRGADVQLRLEASGVDMAAASRDRGGASVLGGVGQAALDMRARLTGPGQIPGRCDGAWRFRITKGYQQSRDKYGALKDKPTRFAYAGASGALANGRATSKDFLLQSEDLTVSGGGWIDLNTSALDCTFTVSKTHFPDFPLRLYGSLDNTRTSIGAGKLLLNTLGGITQGVAGLLGGIAEGVWKVFK